VSPLSYLCFQTFSSWLLSPIAFRALQIFPPSFALVFIYFELIVFPRVSAWWSRRFYSFHPSRPIERGIPFPFGTFLDTGFPSYSSYSSSARYLRDCKILELLWQGYCLSVNPPCFLWANLLRSRGPLRIGSQVFLPQADSLFRFVDNLSVEAVFLFWSDRVQAFL